MKAIIVCLTFFILFSCDLKEPRNIKLPKSTTNKSNKVTVNDSNQEVLYVTLQHNDGLEFNVEMTEIEFNQYENEEISIHSFSVEPYQIYKDFYIIEVILNDEPSQRSGSFTDALQVARRLNIHYSEPNIIGYKIHKNGWKTLTATEFQIEASYAELKLIQELDDFIEKNSYFNPDYEHYDEWKDTNTTIDSIYWYQTI